MAGLANIMTATDDADGIVLVKATGPCTMGVCPALPANLPDPGKDRHLLRSLTGRGHRQHLHRPLALAGHQEARPPHPGGPPVPTRRPRPQGPGHDARPGLLRHHPQLARHRRNLDPPTHPHGRLRRSGRPNHRVPRKPDRSRRKKQTRVRRRSKNLQSRTRSQAGGRGGISSGPPLPSSAGNARRTILSSPKPHTPWAAHRTLLDFYSRDAAVLHVVTRDHNHRDSVSTARLDNLQSPRRVAHPDAVVFPQHVGTPQ